MDAKELLIRARALYEALPECGVDQQTYQELGEAAYFGRPFSQLSAPLRLALLTLVRNGNERAEAQIREAEAKATAAAQTVNETEAAE